MANRRRPTQEEGAGTTRKSTVIAKCLVNSDMIASFQEADNAVQRIFDEEFPDQEFADWNTNVNEDYGAQIVNNVGRAMTIDVRRFIEGLS